MIIPKANRQNPKIFPPVGRCIYCLSDGGTKGLSREHIVAEGLQGSLILQKASCVSCARITSRVETVCLQETYVDYRDHANLKMSKKSKAKLKRRRVAALMLPELPPPGILSGKPLEVAVDAPDPNLVVHGMHCWYFSREKLVALQEGDRPKTFNIVLFLRMLAKIGHSYAIAELGVDNVDSHLNDVILETAHNAKLQYLVGGADAAFANICRPPPEGLDQINPPMHTLHQLFLAPNVTEASTWGLGVGIRLFAIHKTPLYLVAVGSMKVSPELRARFAPALRQANP